MYCNSLYGRPLPWVSHATHLGHEFCEDGTMDMDARIRRGAFIGRCLEIQESFGFAAPPEILGAVKMYCSDMYGGMLYRLDSGPTRALTNCWNTTVKDVWGLPRSSHTVYARWLSSGHSSLREDLLARWPKFFRSLVTGPSPEAAVVAIAAARDARSTTAANNRTIREITGQSVWTVSGTEVRGALRERDTMTVEERETATLLGWALQDRNSLHQSGGDITHLQNYIKELAV